MENFRIISAKDKDLELLTSIKLVTMLDDEMDKKLSYLEKEKVKKSIHQNVEMNCLSYKIIQINNKIAGAFLVIPYDDGYIIDEIYLFQEYRNRGIATQIINKLKKKYIPLYTWVYKNNEGANKLFKKLDFYLVQSGRTNILKYEALYDSLKNKLSSIILGYRDYNGNFYSGFQPNFKETYYLQSSKQLSDSKIGTCFDQVEFMRDFIHKMDYPVRTYFLYYPSEEEDISHAIVVYKDSKRYYWIENAWYKYKGLHIYNNKNELLEDVAKKFVSTIAFGDVRKLKMYSYDKPKYGINYVKFMANIISGHSIRIK